MNDASSHIATAYIARALAGGDAFMAEHYAMAASPVPYWTVTLLLSAFGAVLGYTLAWQLLMALYVVALTDGYWRLIRSEAPDSLPFVAIAAAVAFNWAYYLGELAFIFGQPMVLYGFLLFRRLERPDRKLALFALLATVTYFTHVFALVALIAVCGMQIFGGRLTSGQWAAGGALAALFGLAAWTVFVGHGTDANSGTLVFDLRPYRIPDIIVRPFESPGDALWQTSRIGALALGGLLVAPYVRQGLRGLWSQVNKPFALGALGLFALATVGPAGIEDEMGFEDIGVRFTLMALLFGLPAIKLDRRVAIPCLLVVLGLSTAKLWDTWRVHSAFQPGAARVSALLAEAPTEQRFLLLQSMAEPTDFENLYHRYGNWAVVERHGYSSHVFARTGQQPLEHTRRDEYRPVSPVVTSAEWAEYDYVLVQSREADPAVAGLKDHTEHVRSVDQFHLYRVVR